MSGIKTFSLSTCKKLLWTELPRLVIYQIEKHSCRAPLRGVVINVEHIIPRNHDLHLLFLADAQMNSLRGDRPFGTGKRHFLPPPGSEGIVARALFYFEKVYRGDLEKWVERRLCHEWAERNPPSEIELLRNEAIGTLQGKINPFIPEYLLRRR